MRYKTVKAIGLNTDQQAAQTLSFVGDPENIFLGVLSIVSDDAFTKGRQLLSELSEGFFNPESLNLEDNLSAGERLSKIFSLAKEKLDGSEKIDLLLAVISGKVLYLIAEGEVCAYLKRGEQFSPLFLGQSTNLISGFLQEGDIVYLSTTALKDFLGDSLQKSLQMDIDAWEEEVSSRIGAAGVSDGLAGLLVLAQPEVQKRAAEEVDIPRSYTDEPSTNNGKKIDFAVYLVRARSLLPKSGRIRLVLAVILLLIVLAGVGYKYKMVKDQARVVAFNGLMQEAKNYLNSASDLRNLNSQEAKNKLDSAKEKVNQALDIMPGNQEALEFKKRVESEADSILQQFKQAEFPLFLDLGLIKKDLTATNFSLSVGTLLILDNQSKSLVSVDLAKKSNQVLAGNEQLGDGQAASINGSFAFVFSKDKGLLRVDSTNKKVTSISKTDKNWGSIVDIAGFASNIYLLDATANQIWKYVPTSSGYSDRQEYLAKDVKGDFSKSLRMQIESSVYILKQGGEILRFTKGMKDNFSLGGLDKGVLDPKSFFTSSDTDNLYVLDSGNSRLLILTKTGNFKGQISGDKFGVATDLVVDEKEKKVYLLEGSKIYSVDLK